MEKTLSYKAYIESPYRSTKHSTYFEVYDKLLLEYVGKEIVFVEIGILSGGSLFMWREFFGPKARIIGVDLNPAAKKWEDHGFEIYIGSQSDENFWVNFTRQVGPIDVVLDDGGHTYEQQIITTEMLLPMVRDHGILIVEDTHTSYMRGFGSRRYSFIEYAKKMIDRCNQRFSGSGVSTPDRRVWSIQCFESVTAFHVNREATKLLSSPTDNLGINDNAVDFRVYRPRTPGRYPRILKRLKILKYFPGARHLSKLLYALDWSDALGSRSTKKYFKLGDK